MKIPQITWSQNQKFIYLNINVEPLEDNVLDISENNLKFKQGDYEIELELSNNIDTEKCKITKNRIFELDLPKQEHKFWTNLLKDPTLYKNNISINWNRWVDEDDDDDIYNNILNDEDVSDDEDVDIPNNENILNNDTSDDENEVEVLNNNTSDDENEVEVLNNNTSDDENEVEVLNDNSSDDE